VVRGNERDSGSIIMSVTMTIVIIVLVISWHNRGVENTRLRRQLYEEQNKSAEYCDGCGWEIHECICEKISPNSDYYPDYDENY